MKRLILSFIFATLCGISAFAANYYDFSARCSSGQTLYYNITSSTEPYSVAVTYPNYYNGNYYYNFSKPTGNLTIPSSVTYSGRTYSVTSIGENAFYGCSGLTSVTIPNSVTSIGYYAFFNCSGLTSVTIPNSITSIGNSAFYGCNSSYNQYDNAYYLGNVENQYLVLVTKVSTDITSCNINNDCKFICNGAFLSCSNLSSITIPNSVTSINKQAFCDCSGLTSATIGNSVISIGEQVFKNCSGLTSVIIGNAVTNIGGDAFYNCSGLTSLTIGNSVTSIGVRAFYGCAGLTSVTISNSVTNIGALAFSDCIGLTSLSIPNSVTSIGQYAFYNCSGLTSVTIGDGVTSIGTGVFNGCSGLEDMTIPFVGSSATATEASDSTLFGYMFEGNRYNGGTSVGQYYDDNSYRTYYIPSSLRSVTVTGGKLNYGAFYGCSMLTSVTIGNSVTSIGEKAFYGCSGLPSLTIGNSVTSIGKSAFYGCSGLASVTMGRAVTSIGESAFYGCSGLTSVYNSGTIDQWCGIRFGNPQSNPIYYTHNLYMNNSLVTSLDIQAATRIEQYAFYEATCLTSVSIGNSVTSIGNNAFYGCSGLEEMTIPFVGSSATATEASDSTLFGYLFGTSSYTGGQSVTQYYSSSSNKTYYIPSSLRSVAVTGGNLNYGAFYGCSMLTSITIGNGVTSIGESAFYNCSGLAGTLTIPSSVTNIGSKAFYGCSGLTSVGNCEGVTSIGSDAFYGCSGLTSVYYSRNIDKWCGITFGNPKSNPLYYAHNLYQSYGFEFYSSLVTSCVFGTSVTEIKPYAFYGATCLTYVSIPSWVTSIGESAFSGCSGLTEMTIPFAGSSATATEASASTLFGYIFGMTSYTGGTSVRQYYEDNSFKDYYIPSSLRSVTITGSNTGGNLLFGAFSNCSMLTSVTIGNLVTSIGIAAFSGCSGLTSVTIGREVTIIKSGAFYNCSGLRTVTIGQSVTGIRQGAFSGCNGITDIYANPLTPPETEYCGLNSAATLWVRCGFAAAYRRANFWSNFSDIRERLLYTINVSSEDLTMGTASVTQQPTCSNDNATIVATPNEGYRFVQWNDGNTENPRTITVTSNVEYTASFEALPTYTITAVSADEEMGTVTGGGDYYEGETITLTATANDGYWFVAWTDGNTDNPRTVTVTGDATYTATFIAFHTITVTSADETLGTASGSGDYAEGLEIEISATPAEHYHFAQWNDGNTDNPRTIIVTEDATYTASFAIDRFTVTVESADAEMGTVSESGTYDYGTEIQISATPAEGYGFVAWNDGNADNPRTVIVTEDITYTATFGVLRTISVVSADETMGTVQGTGEYVEGATAQITAIPNEHYHFVHWIVDENPTREIITDNPLTITVTGNITYTAVFAIDQHTITVESTDASMGTVSEGGTFDYGTEMQISATASEHYHFVQWNDGNTDNPRTITVTEDATYRAEFAIDRFTITVESADEAMGIVSESNTYDYGTEIQISATAREHYHFVQWNDTNTDNPRTITVTEDATYMAEFAIDRFTITVESADEAMGTVSEGGTYDYGSEIQISATARDGYQFVSWDDGNTDNPRTITVVADATYIASFMSVVGIEENAVSEIAIFPNPATDILNITSSETISEIEIVNTLGQVVKRIEVNSDNAVCNVEDLKAGVYVVRIYGNPCTSTGSVSGIIRKFVKE